MTWQICNQQWRVAGYTQWYNRRQQRLNGLSTTPMLPTDIFIETLAGYKRWYNRQGISYLFLHIVFTAHDYWLVDLCHHPFSFYQSPPCMGEFEYTVLCIFALRRVLLRVMLVMVAVYSSAYIRQPCSPNPVFPWHFSGVLPQISDANSSLSWCEVTLFLHVDYVISAGSSHCNTPLMCSCVQHICYLPLLFLWHSLAFF